MKKLFNDEVKTICEYVMLNGDRSDWKNVVESLNLIRDRYLLDLSTDFTASEVNNLIEYIVSVYLNLDLHDDGFNLRMLRLIYELDECNK